jgi:hypothetical protein
VRATGASIGEGEEKTWQGVTVVPGPKLVVAPEVCVVPGDMKNVFAGGAAVKVSGRSSLVVKGSGKVVIESLDLDGALVIDGGEGGVVVKGLKVRSPQASSPTTIPSPSPF